MTMKTLKWLLSALLLVSSVCQSSFAGRSEPLYVIDHPTAGLLGNGEYLFSGRIGPQSFQVGTSFGMQKLFDRGDVDVNDKIGFQFRLRLLEEYATPALAVGFDSQGKGFYHAQEKRYDRKSPGFYVVLSKNYTTLLGQVALHGGMNYSTENKDDDDPDLFFGTDWALLDQLSVLFDFDAAFNDNVDAGNFGKGSIYVDAGVRMHYAESLSLMFIFRDLTSNFRPAAGVGRELEIAFWDSF
jgi:hypothetical protein